MPKIPVYNERQVQTSSNIAVPRASGQLPQDNTGATLTGIGSELAKAAQRVEARRDDLAASKAYGEMYDSIREITYGQDGYFNKEGDFVLENSSKKLMEDVEGIRNKYAGKLAGRQVQIFNDKANPYLDRVHTAAARHEAAQLKTATIAHAEADADTAAQEAGRLYSAPLDEQLEVISGGMTSKERSLIAQGKADPGVIKNELQKYSSGILKSSIEALAEEDPVAAKDRFEEVEKDLLSGHADELRKKLFNETVRARAQAKTDELFLQYADDPKAGLAAARGLDDDALREATVKRIKARYDERDAFEKQAYEDLNDKISDELFDMKRQGLNQEAMLSHLDSYKDKLETTEQRQHESYIDRQAGPKKVSVSNEAARAQARRRIDSGEITSVEQLQREYAEYLTPGHLNETADYFDKKGNLQYLKDSTARSVFEDYVRVDSEERQGAYNKFWDFLKTKLEPGFKPTDDDIRGFAKSYFELMGESERSFLFPDKEETRAQAIRAGRLDRFRPWTDAEQGTAQALIRDFNARPENRDRQIDPDDPVGLEAVIKSAVRGQ